MNPGLSGSGACVLSALPSCPELLPVPTRRLPSPPDSPSKVLPCFPPHGSFPAQASASLTQLLLAAAFLASLPPALLLHPSLSPLRLGQVRVFVLLAPNTLSPPLRLRFLFIFHAMVWMIPPPPGSLPELSQTPCSPCVMLGKSLPHSVPQFPHQEI